jgi:hypothetical protein
MTRLDFYNSVVTDGVKEKDVMFNSLSLFKIRRPVNYYIVTDSDIKRPDIISYRCYNTVTLWWVIMYINQILNPLVDIKVGMSLTIPSVFDIWDWQNKYSLANRTVTVLP